MLGLSDYCQVRDVVWEEKGWGVRRDLFERGLRAILVLLFGNTEGGCPKLPSCWSALRPSRAEERKVGGKVPVTSFLRPHWGLRRGRARFLWKYQAGAGDGGAPPVGLGARVGGLAPDAGCGKPLPCTPSLVKGAWSRLQPRLF